MKKSSIFTMAATAAIALTVIAAPTSTAAPKPDRSYIGTWELASWNIDGTTVDCPGTLSLPAPAPPIECSDGQFLKLAKNARYTTNVSVFRSTKHPT